MIEYYFIVNDQYGQKKTIKENRGLNAEEAIIVINQLKNGKQSELFDDWDKKKK